MIFRIHQVASGNQVQSQPLTLVPSPSDEIAPMTSFSKSRSQLPSLLHLPVAPPGPSAFCSLSQLDGNFLQGVVNILAVTRFQRMVTPNSIAFGIV